MLYTFFTGMPIFQSFLCKQIYADSEVCFLVTSLSERATTPEDMNTGNTSHTASYLVKSEVHGNLKNKKKGQRVCSLCWGLSQF